jgi:hypothetical protein
VVTILSSFFSQFTNGVFDMTVALLFKTKVNDAGKKINGCDDGEGVGH